MILLLICVLIAAFCFSFTSSSRIKHNPTTPQTPVDTDACTDTEKSNLKPEVNIFTLLPEKFIVLDLETTGLNPYKDEIIEFGAIRVSLDSDTHPGFQTLVKPQGIVSKKITEITGITQEMLDRDGIALTDALSQFVEFIGDLPLVTYNAEFDMGFLHNACQRNNIAIRNRYTCALKRARRAWPNLPSHRLADIAKVMELSDKDSHRALGDCRRTLIVFVEATREVGTKIRWSKAPSEK